VQFQQPLTLLHIRFSSGNVLGPTRIHQVHFQTLALQNVIHRDPVHPGGVQHHRADAAALQPPRHLFQCRCPRPEFPHWLRVSSGWYGHVMALVPHINVGRIPIHNFQPRVTGIQTLLHLFPWLTIQLATTP
jgi:hypothetical protein